MIFALAVEWGGGLKYDNRREMGESNYFPSSYR